MLAGPLYAADRAGPRTPGLAVLPYQRPCLYGHRNKDPKLQTVWLFRMQGLSCMLSYIHARGKRVARTEQIGLSLGRGKLLRYSKYEWF